MAAIKLTNSVFRKKLLILLLLTLLFLFVLTIFSANCLSVGNSNLNSNIAPETEIKNFYESDEISPTDNIFDANVKMSKEIFPLESFIPDGWNSPLVISDNKGARDVEFYLVADEIFISWAIVNLTERVISKVFYVDLLLDGVPVERWQFFGISPGQSYSVSDWSELTDKAYLSKGVHELSIDIDSTNVLTDAVSFSDNYSINFTWNQYTKVNTFENNNNILNSRFPNLEFFIPDGWETPIEIYSEEEFALDPSSDRIDLSDVSLQFAYVNNGLTTVDGYYQVHIYLNEIFASKFSRWGVIPGEHVISTPLYTLFSDLELDYGEYKLKVILDPTLMIKESNENDNEYSLQLIWSKNGVVIKPQSLSVVNNPSEVFTDVHAYKFEDWSDPLIFSHELGVYKNNKIVHSESPLFVSWALENYGYRDVEFEAELFLDGVLIEKWDRPNLPVGSIDMILDFPLNRVIGYGFHNVLLRINTLSGESIDIYEDQFYWDKGLHHKFPNSQSVTFLTNFADYWVMHNGLKFPEDQVIVEELTFWMSILYEEIHGQSIDNNLLVHVVDTAEYYRWIESECRDKAKNLSFSMRSIYVDNCQRGQHSNGYYTNWQGFNRIIIKWDLRPMEFIAVMSHELGHYHQSKQRNELDDSYDSKIIALKECQAYVHQSLMIKALEQKLGFELMAYPATRAYEEFIKNEITMMSNKIENPHAYGKLLAWNFLLNDPALRLQRTNLFNNLKLDVINEKFFFDYLIQLNARVSSVNSGFFISDIATLSNTIESFAVARLKNGLVNSEQGDPFLRTTALLIP